jgi:phosphatidylserine decarboxylase
VSTTPTIGARLFVALQYLLPQHLLSRLVGCVARARSGWIRRPLTLWFVRHYQPELGDALEPDPQAYPSFNAFFTRALRPGARPLAGGDDAILSPVDGRISACGRCYQGAIVQAKGRDYSLRALLAGNESLAARLCDGPFMTIYLAPFNYHRVHMALAGRLVGAWYVPGRLFSVNDASASLVPGLFARNERVILEFGGERAAHAIVLVGALFVGSMSTVWHGEVAPERAAGAVPLPVDATRAALARGAELGRFNMGSTVIVLLPPGAGHWDPAVAASQTLRLGQRIGTLGSAALSTPGAAGAPGGT